MVQFNDWCSATNTDIGAHTLRILSGDPERQNVGVGATAAIVPGHYVAEEQLSRILARLGKPAAAKFIREKLPTTKSIRSGDLGEILATEYVATRTGFEVPIKRLRWKDHRDMAMRGEDVIGIVQDQANGGLRFLKTEAKSRVKLSVNVLNKARGGLDKDGGLPSAHALSFISARLLELGNNALADAIDDAQLKFGIPAKAVQHLLFTFSGNVPDEHFTASLQAYTGPIVQLGVGLHVNDHAAFVCAVYDKVITNANNR